MSERILPKNAILIPPQAERVFKGKIFDVYQWQQEMFDGSKQTYEMLKRPDSVAILGLDDDDQIITVNEEQAGARKVSGSLPFGRVDEADESLLEAAKREMKEETGYKFKDWLLVVVVQPQTKIEWFVYLYVARNIIATGHQKLDPGERIEVTRSSFDDIKPILMREFPQLSQCSSVSQLIDSNLG